MAGSRSGVLPGGHDQFAAPEGFERDLDSGLRKTGRVRKRSQTRDDRFPFVPSSLAVKIEINEISRWSLVVSNEIAHQDVQNVILDGNGLFEASHGKTKERMGIMKSIRRRPLIDFEQEKESRSGSIRSGFNFEFVIS
jgi:hypothetical protein